MKVMFPYCSDYTWQDGLPTPLDRVEPASTEECYRVVHDPYRKRVTLERYRLGRFDGVGYDSALLDFRNLGEAQQTAWRKEMEEERGIIRDENDRALLIETYEFEGERCRSCHLTSPQGISIGVQRLYYEDFGDSFSGVVLLDAWEHPVLLKRYALSSDGTYGKLLEERWDMQGATDGQSFNQ